LKNLEVEWFSYTSAISKFDPIGSRGTQSGSAVKTLVIANSAEKITVQW
jgi:hypothetical protein